ncbi:MAG: DUF4382 domain-containing protein [Steroidobacteraceae bacterium]|nr:DUF4382 domain-containing protein [Steroidobacteraceae bacterium]MCC7198407.1 DUF4382 domain-containing protein [Gammaproteobacteria bacterium]
MQHAFTRLGRTLVLACMATVLAACGGSGSDTKAPTTGTLSLKLTDSPIDNAAKVVVVFTGVELQRADGTRVMITLPAPREIDLLPLQDGRTVSLLDGTAVEAGAYQWMRLLITAEQNLQSGSYIQMMDGNRYPLYIPSGSETGLKLQHAFNVAQGAITRLVIDFDLRKSVHAPPGQAPNWFLRPTLRLMDELKVGTVAGTINLTDLATAQGTTLAACKPGLYLFNGLGATPDDMDGITTDGNDPVIYRMLPNDGVTTTVSYTVPFVEAAAYTLAATCNYDVDASAALSEYDPTALAATPPAANPPGFQTMKWSKKDVTVLANQTATVTLP